MDAATSWDELHLPERELKVLRKLAGTSRASALFLGADRKGKLAAAELLANELTVDVYRVGLSAVVSKYIGETEKNLSRVFDAAEAGGAILLFDEADALFGKRTETESADLIFARLGEYPGLVVLLACGDEPLDEERLRRVRFVVRFRRRR
jgi:SpoVK/Ycf46/Vps4 family AAA+-type ATPase